MNGHTRTPEAAWIEFPTDWARRSLLIAAIAVLAMGAGTGCAAMQEIVALRQVKFAFDRISDVRLAGVSADGRRSYSDLRADEIARVAAAVATRQVPVELIVHLSAENPTSNGTTARLQRLDWKMFLDDRALVDGQLAEAYAFEPGVPVDLPLRVRFDAIEFVNGSARDLFELALALAGAPNYRKEVRLDLVPTIDTSIGPIRYPTPITVRRTTGS